MLASYINDPTLFDRCISLIDSIFPGIKKVAQRGMQFQARWDRASMPFIAEDKGAVIAHLGILPIDMMLDGRLHHIGALHGICVQESYRGRGIFKKLMHEAMNYVHDHFDSAILFTNKTHLYEKYGFRVMDEYDFLLDYRHPEKPVSTTRQLMLENERDLRLLQDLLSDHLPVSLEASVVNEKTIFVLDNLDRKILYSEALQAILVYEIKEGSLFFRDILSRQQHSLLDIIDAIPDAFDRIVFQFCPEKIFKEKIQEIPARPDDGIMVSDQFIFHGEYFRFPEPYRC
jgi:GNAT superfamily N-acetyltransferase